MKGIIPADQLFTRPQRDPVSRRCLNESFMILTQLFIQKENLGRGFHVWKETSSQVNIAMMQSVTIKSGTAGARWCPAGEALLAHFLSWLLLLRSSDSVLLKAIVIFVSSC